MARTTQTKSKKGWQSLESTLMRPIGMTTNRWSRKDPWSRNGTISSATGKSWLTPSSTLSTNYLPRNWPTSLNPSERMTTRTKGIKRQLTTLSDRPSMLERQRRGRKEEEESETKPLGTANSRKYTCRDWPKRRNTRTSSPLLNLSSTTSDCF